MFLPTPTMTKEECLKHGGHCWVDSGGYYRHAMPGAMAVGEEYCKHCPTRRKKIEQPQWRYEEI